jgi:hypothetical protein
MDSSLLEHPRGSAMSRAREVVLLVTERSDTKAELAKGLEEQKPRGWLWAPLA